DLVKEEIALDMIRIGEGEIESSYAPISNYGTANYSISQQIYTKDEINMESGNIIGISFRNKNGNANTRDITVFMSNTVQDSYRDSHDWVLIEESQIVYDGEFTFGTQDEWTTIELQNPFTYNGNNIAISVYDASSNSLGYSGNHDSFYSHATDTLRGIYKTSSEKINIYSIDEELYCYELKTSVYVNPAHQYYVNDIMMEFCALPEVETPSVPQNLSANTIDARSISLSWTSAKNATSYNVYLGTEKLANVTTTYYLAEGLEPNTESCFTIAAANSISESEKSAEACAKTLDNVGLEELSSSINIYPNPVKDKLYIETDVEIEDVVVYDVFGRQQDNKTTQQQDNVTIDVSKLDAGVYFVKIKTAEGENVKRIVKRN
ncbi:MAG: T9SS type A sorting domain-containing protein, partial [Bacteroidales bacterium]|nr:T9SS type A sorting domain-containing protein [Bacteroidales bacterium]